MATTIFTPLMLRGAGTRGIPEIPAGSTPPSFNNIYSLAFDGVDDYVDLGTSSTLEFTNDFSVSVWIKDTGALNRGIFCCGDRSGTSGWMLYRTSADKVAFSVYTANNRIATSTTSINTGDWFNVIGTFEKNGTANQQVKVYVNGSLEDQNGWISAQTPAYPGTIYKQIAFPYAGTNEFLGNIDEVAAFNYLLSTDEINTISTAPSDLTSLNPTAWYRMGDNGSYKSPQWLIPNNSNKDKVSNYSFDFDGVDDYVDFGNPTSLQITTDLSVSFWFKGSSTADQAIVAKDTLGLRCWGIWNNVFGAGNNLQFYIFNSNSLTEVQTSANYNDGNWHNVVCVFKPSTYLRIYVDGVLDGENTTSIPATIDNDLANLTVGAILSSGSPIYEFEGNVDEVAIWNSDQSANVASIYNSGTPTTLPSGTVAHYKMGEEANFTDNWLVNNSALSNYSTRSFNFDGVDDIINVPYNSSLNVVTGNHSLSFWLKTTNGSTQIVTEKGSSDELASWIVVGGSIRWAGANSFDSSTSVNDGNWKHIVFVADGSTSYIYVNGSLDATGGNKIQASANALDFVIGARANNSFNYQGQLDEIAIFNVALTQENVTAIYNSGTPSDLTSLSPLSWWRMGEDATFSTNWSLPDNGSASNTGTSVNMTIADLEGEAPNYTGGGLSANMTIEDRVGDAPNSTSNAVSFNMTEADRETNVPT